MAEQKDNFRYIVRVANTDIDGKKSILLAMRKIKGVGFMFSQFVCRSANIPITKQAGSLSDEEVARLQEVILNPSKFAAPSWMLNRRHDPETGEDHHLILGDLQFAKETDIKTMKKSKSYKGLRHQWGLTVRGQRTKSNFRKNKGKNSKAVKVTGKKKAQQRK